MELYLQEKAEVLGEKLVPITMFPPHGLMWNGTRIFAIKILQIVIKDVGK